MQALIDKWEQLCWRLKKNMTLIQLQIFKFMPEKQQWHQIKSYWTLKSLKEFLHPLGGMVEQLSLHVLPVHTHPPNNQASSHRPKTLNRPWLWGSWSAECMNVLFNMTGSLKHFEWVTVKKRRKKKKTLSIIVNIITIKHLNGMVSTVAS